VSNCKRTHNDLYVSYSCFICLRIEFRTEINYESDTGILSGIKTGTYIEICFGIHLEIINDAGIGFNIPFGTGIHIELLTDLKNESKKETKTGFNRGIY
jgi:hypothetical protein